MPGETAANFPAGSFWYVDCEPVDDDTAPGKDIFKLTKLEKPSEYSLTIRLNYQAGAESAYLEITISNKAVWDMYWNKIDSLYRVTMTRTTKEG